MFSHIQEYFIPRYMGFVLEIITIFFALYKICSLFIQQTFHKLSQFELLYYKSQS